MVWAPADSPTWRAEVEAWVRASVRAWGQDVAGPTELVRVRPWSVQLRTPTTAGPVWIKANAPGMEHEPALHDLLARLAPARVDAPLAVDSDRAWMLTRDSGITLADEHEPSLEEWFEIVQEAADLQRRLVPHAAQVLGTGLPDCSPTTVPERFDTLLETYAALDRTHPSHLTRDERQRFESVRADVERAAAALSAGPLPVTLDHGDLHPGNVFVVDGGLRLFDFGDAQWAAAPEALGALWGWLVQRTEHPWRRVFAAYAEVWCDRVTAAEFDELVGAAMVTLPVNRSQTWRDAVAGAEGVELAEWGGAPLSQLRHLFWPWPGTDG